MPVIKDQVLSWPVGSKTKPDLIIFDPPYFNKKADGYGEKSISGLPRGEYLEFLGVFFSFLKRNVKKTTLLAFINADWRNFQNRGATKLLAACFGSWCMVNFQLSVPGERPDPLAIEVGMTIIVSFND